MMKQMRSRKAMRRVMIATLFLVIPAFVFMYAGQGGSGQRGQDGSSTVFASIKLPGELRRTELTTEDWVRARRQLVGEVAGQMGETANTSRIEQAVPRKRIAEEAVNTYALGKVASDMGFQVTDGEISHLITQSFPGATHEEIANYARNQLRMSLRQWLQEVRDNQRLSKAQTYLQSAAHVALPDLWRQYSAQATSVGLTYVDVPVLSRRESLVVTEDEIAREYEKRREELQIGDQAVYEYVALSRNEIRQTARVSDAEILNKYQSVRDQQFLTPGQATVRHVLIQVEPGAASEAEEEARQRIENIRAKAQAGVPLSELADEHSEDPANISWDAQDTTETLKLGGLMPTPIQSNQYAIWGRDFVDAVFSAPLDTLSETIRVPMGWSVFEVIARTEPREIPLEDVRGRVEGMVREEKMAALLEEKQKAFETARRIQTTLEGIAQALDTQVRETSATLVGSDRIVPLGSVRDYVSEVADLLPGGEPTGVIETTTGFAVLRMRELIPAHQQTLEEARAKLIEDIKARRALEEALAEAKTIARRVADGDSLTSVALELGYPYESTPDGANIALGTPGYPYNQMRDLAAWTLRTPVGATFITEGFRFGSVTRNLYVCQVNEIVKPDREEFLKEAEQMSLERLVRGQRVLLTGYFDQTRKTLDPKFNPDIVASDF